MGSAWAILIGSRPPVSDSVSDAALLALFAPYCGGLAREQIFVLLCRPCWPESFGGVAHGKVRRGMPFS